MDRFLQFGLFDPHQFFLLVDQTLFQLAGPKTDQIDTPFHTESVYL